MFYTKGRRNWAMKKKKNFVSNAVESQRMFKNDFLEKLSKVHFSIPIIIYVPVILYYGWKGWIGSSALEISISLVSGLFFWTLTEYILHRFVFHFEPKSKFGKRIHFIFHGVHHDYPNDARRLVMPPSVSIPLAVVFYFLFSVILPIRLLYAFFAAFMFGYLFYDITHYALHHASLKGAFWKRLKHRHMQHHYSNPDRGYGVSSSLWDTIFRSNF
jgi:sterol desaturase/sphingolipid hydroxylase (fatty acid hydroxylase superfamily)